MIMKGKTIEFMFASAYENALTNVADEINKQMGTNFSYVRDWASLDIIAGKLGVRFDDNGEIIK